MCVLSRLAIERYGILSSLRFHLTHIQAAFDALRNCIRLYPYNVSFPHTLNSPEDLTSPGLTQLAGAVDRLTILGAVELLLPAPEITLLASSLPSSVTGTLIERQAHALLASGSASRKPAIQSIAAQLFDDALRVYTAEDTPVRRARVLLAKMEAGYYTSLDENSVDFSTVGEEVLSLTTKGVSTFRSVHDKANFDINRI